MLWLHMRPWRVLLLDGGIGKTALMTWKSNFEAPYSHNSHVPIGYFEDQHSSTWYNVLICPIPVSKLCQKSINTPDNSLMTERE